MEKTFEREKCPVCKKNIAMESGICDACNAYFIKEEQELGHYSCEEHCCRPTDEPCEEHPVDCSIARAYYKAKMEKTDITDNLDDLDASAVINVEHNEGEKFPLVITIHCERFIEPDGIMIIANTVNDVINTQKSIDEKRNNHIIDGKDIEKVLKTELNKFYGKSQCHEHN